MKKTSPSSSSKASKPDPFLYLTTRGRQSGRPREIEIWFTQQKGRFYVIAEHESSHWVRNLQAHAEVRIRVGSRSGQARARVLDPEVDAALYRQIQELSRKKYGWGDGLVVQLTPERRQRNEGA